MTASPTRDSCVVFNTAAFQEKIHAIGQPFLHRFFSINRGFVLFHAFYLSLLSFELLFFGLFFSSFIQSTAMAFFLAGMFLSLFTYLVLFFYLHGRRPEKWMQLRDEYLTAVRSCIPFEMGSLEYHCCITEAIVSLISSLRIDSVLNRWVRASETLTFLIEKFRIWTRWKDLLRLKEMLLLSSIEEHIRLIKEAPADLEAHASLASNYVTLACLYQDPKKLALNEQLSWHPPEYDGDEMRSKFETALERALEEYHIIDEYAPNDPWVHAQRASLYRELDRLEDERKEYERILEMDPDNKEILVRLGKLYFRKGENAKGLKIYDQLQRIDREKAKEIITYYDIYSVEQYSFSSS